MNGQTDFRRPSIQCKVRKPKMTKIQSQLEVVVLEIVTSLSLAEGVATKERTPSPKKLCAEIWKQQWQPKKEHKLKILFCGSVFSFWDFAYAINYSACSFPFLTAWELLKWTISTQLLPFVCPYLRRLLIQSTALGSEVSIWSFPSLFCINAYYEMCCVCLCEPVVSHLAPLNCVSLATQFVMALREQYGIFQKGKIWFYFYLFLHIRTWKL